MDGYSKGMLSTYSTTYSSFYVAFGDCGAEVADYLLSPVLVSA